MLDMAEALEELFGDLRPGTSSQLTKQGFHLIRPQADASYWRARRAAARERKSPKAPVTKGWVEEMPSGSWRARVRVGGRGGKVRSIGTFGTEAQAKQALAEKRVA